MCRALGTGKSRRWSRKRGSGEQRGESEDRGKQDGATSWMLLETTVKTDFYCKRNRKSDTVEIYNLVKQALNWCLTRLVSSSYYTKFSALN